MPEGKIVLSFHTLDKLDSNDGLERLPDSGGVIGDPCDVDELAGGVHGAMSDVLSMNASSDFDVPEDEDELDPLDVAEMDDQSIFEEIDFDSLGIDPGRPTVAKPGSEEKVLMLAARYAAGVPLWNENDADAFGPSEADELKFLVTQRNKKLLPKRRS